MALNSDIVKAPEGSEATVELSENGKRLVVRFDYDQRAVTAIKTVPSYKFDKNCEGEGPAWTFPLDITIAQRIREVFGSGLTIGQRAREWAQKETRKANNLASLSTADDAELPNLREYIPDLADWMRPYQRAGAAFMAGADGAINADHPGLGKTIETITAVFERGNDLGAHLIIAPKTSLKTVWLKELERWQEYPVLTTSGDDTKEERQAVLDLAKEMAEEELPFWLVVNPAMVRYYRNTKAPRILVKGKWEYPTELQFPTLHEINWTTLVVDEFHKMGLSNTSTGFYKAVAELSADHKMLLSGTPVGGKPVKLYGALHTIDPDRFPSKWRWVDEWLETEDNGYGKVVLGIKQGREEAFYEHLRPYMIRRTKDEVAKDLPAKQYIDIWCEMTPRQAKQYEAMEANAEVKIEEENLTATGILAEYTRLKQFAGSHCKVKNMGDGKMVVTPTGDSGKMPHIFEILSDLGITKDDDEGDEQVVICSQFNGVINMVAEALTKEGIKFAKITGGVKQEVREENVENFQAGKIRVMILNTMAGGVSITLDRASTMIELDETWDPDDQEQVEDRIHRISRIHQVTIYRIRSKGTIEEYIEQVTMNKSDINREILDVHRRIMKQRAKMAVAA